MNNKGTSAVGVLVQRMFNIGEKGTYEKIAGILRINEVLQRKNTLQNVLVIA